MQVGVLYPQNELGGDPTAVREFALAAEALGYRHLSAYDHVLGAPHDGRMPELTGPYTERDPFHEPLVMLAYLAGITERLELGTDVLVLPQRQAALVAKQAADIDLLAGGRLRIGVGTGWNFVEYEAMGTDFATRGARLDEQIDVMRALWTQPLVDVTGRFHRVDRASILPRPTRSIPIWVGGYSEPAYRRGGQRGDGFLFAGSIDVALAGRERVRHFATEAGRDPASLGWDFTANRANTPAGTAELAELWREAGGTHFSVGSMRNGIDSLAGHLDFIDDVARLLRLQP